MRSLVWATKPYCMKFSLVSQPTILLNFPRKVFEDIHTLSYPSILSTWDLITKKFMWCGRKNQVGTWAKSCIDCLTLKVHRHVKALLETFKVPKRRFNHIHVDLDGLPAQSNGRRYLFTIVDHFTRWPEAIPLLDVSNESCAQALVNQWITRFRLATEISFNEVSQFTSKLWSVVAQLLGVKHCHTTTYHPQANDLWSASLGIWNLHYELDWRDQIRFEYFLGFFLALEQHQRITWQLLLQNWFLAHQLQFVETSSLHWHQPMNLPETYFPLYLRRWQVSC